MEIFWFIFFIAVVVAFIKESLVSVREKRKRESEERLSSLTNIISNTCLTENSDLDALKLQVQEKLNGAKQATAQDVLSTLASGWDKAVEVALEDGLLSDDEKRLLLRFRDHYALGDLAANGNRRMEQCEMLEEILAGRIPDRVCADSRINLQKNEKFVYQCSNVDYHEVVTQSRIRGSSHGLSIRIAKGVYYRPSVFSAGAESTSSMEYIETGEFVVTDKHIYFIGDAKRFRIPYKKIVAFEPYQDGIGIQKDGVRAKPQTFITDEGWFIYNLVTNLSRM